MQSANQQITRQPKIFPPTDRPIGSTPFYAFGMVKTMAMKIVGKVGRRTTSLNVFLGRAAKRSREVGIN